MFAHAHHQTKIAASHPSLVTRLLDFVLAADAGFRGRERLRKLSPDLLKDIGLSQRERSVEPPAYDPSLDF
jgi:uncharacterized protein YjiS (DUF1127 family)